MMVDDERVVDPDVDVVKDPKWIIAQEGPGLVNSTWWSIIDTANRFVRGRWFGRDNAQLVVDLLNENDRAWDDTLEEIASMIESMDLIPAERRKAITDAVRRYQKGR